MIGKTISHYRLLEKLGEGGMGVVYKAEDTKLMREVAIKFLPRHIAASAEERERFKIEAQAAAALNHPNIATIHAIEEVDDEMFIVMEFIEGQELKKKLTSGQFSVNNVINLATQIADGLQAAHAKSITHRDIKSSNIMVTDSGQAKIMDFGLAKIGSGAHLTKSGMTLGTAAYMSPEQARGEPVDQRTDIWSFGIVLYEMLTGQLPFNGVYEQAILYAIVNEEPEPVQKYLPQASSELLHVLHRALEKVSDDRYQSASDMLIDLRRLKKETASVSPVLSGKMKIAASRAAIVTPRASKKKTWLVLGALVVLAIVVSVLLLLPRRATELNPNMTFRVLPIPFAQNNYPSLSPDGNWLVFSAADANGKWNVYLMNINGGEPRRITTDSSDFIETLSISPDGAHVIYERTNHRLRKTEICLVSSLGGTSKMVVGLGLKPRWRPDGQRIGYIMGHPNGYGYSKSGKLEFWSVKPDGSDNHLEFVDSTIAGFNTRCSVSWSPDGKFIAWIRTFPEGHAEVFVRELETGKERQLTFDQKMIDEVCWAPNDQIIFSSNKSGNTNLWMVPANGGQTVQITKGSGPDLGIAISDDGKKLVYLQRKEIDYLWIARIDGSNARQITSDEHKIRGFFFSPNGQRLLVCMGDPDILKPAIPLYVMNRDGSNRQQIIFDDQVTTSPRWSPDGKWIAYCAISTSEPIDSIKTYLIEASNLGNSRLLGRGFTQYWIDSQSLIVKTTSNSWLFFVNGKAPQRLSEDSTFAVPIFGEKHVVLQDLRKGREGWWIAATTDWRSPAMRSLKKILGPLPDSQVRLAPSRKFLLYRKNAEELWKITLPDGKAQRLPGTFPFLKSSFNVSYDGQEIIWPDRGSPSKLVMIENLFK